MQGQIFFQPSPTVTYKIVSVLDGNKTFTLQPGTNKLILQDFNNLDTQKFHVYLNNGKYAFVSTHQQNGLHIVNENQADGGVVQGVPDQHPSSYFEIVPVTTG